MRRPYRAVTDIGIEIYVLSKIAAIRLPLLWKSIDAKLLNKRLSRADPQTGFGLKVVRPDSHSR